MAILNIQETVDNVTSKIVKEDKLNTDILSMNLPFNFTISVGDTVNYKDGTNTLIFSGIVQNIKTGAELVVEVYDHGSELLQRVVNQIFINKKPEEIIEEIIDTYTTLTYVSTITSTAAIPTYVSNKKRAWDVVTEMSELLLANFMVDKDKNFQLELEGENNSSKAISSSTANLDTAWKEDKSKMANVVTVDGDDRQVFEREPELFSGTGSPQTITFAEIPINLKLENPLGTTLDGFVEGSTTGDYTLDRENKQATGTFSNGASNVRATYNVSIPISVRRRDKTSIDNYTQHEKVFKKPYIKTRDDARELAVFLIGRFANPLLQSTWIITDIAEFNDFENYVPNEVINVDDIIRGISGSFIIRKVERDSTGTLKIVVGEPDDDFIAWSKEAQQRIKQLEEKDDNSTILSEDEFVQETAQMQFDLDVLDIIQRTFDSDTFYLEDDSGGTRNQMLDDGTGPIMRDTGGYTDTDLDGGGVERVTEAGVLVRITESGNERITEADPSDVISEGSVSGLYINAAVSDFISELNNNITHMAVGDDNTAPTEGNTTLGNETYRDALFSTSVTANSIGFTMFMDTTENNGNNIEEVGTFDASSGGNMYNRDLTNIIVKDNTKEVFVEIQIQVNGVNTNIS